MPRRFAPHLLRRLASVRRNNTGKLTVYLLAFAFLFLPRAILASSRV